MSRTTRATRVACLAALAFFIATIIAPPAGAELLNSRQEWLRNSTVGLFMHWGMRTYPAHTDCQVWEDAVTNGGWNADYWVDEALKLHAQYIVLATFHSRLGYARPWPSEIPGSCSTNRDFLGELIAAAKAKRVKVILYMTDDPKWYWEGSPPGGSWFDSAAYSAYKGEPVDLTTRWGFGMFSYDNFVEVMHNYPDLAGFWIDNDNEYWEQNGLYERIRAERPDMLLSNNNEDTPIMDTVSHEQKTGMTPPYDYPAATWTPLPRIIEGEYKLPTGGSWWYDGQDRDVDYPLNVGRVIANAGASIKSLIDETPQVNGKFPSKQEAFNNFMAGYLTPIWKSINGVEGGGYMFGGLQPGAWNNGAYGTATVDKHEPDIHYIHVITPPSTNFLRVRDNGYRIARVTNFRTGAELQFSQSGGYVTIQGITNWDQYDTVLQVDTAGREGIYPPDSVTATATASADGYPASNLVDSDYLTWWDNGGTIPVTLTLDLGRPKKIAYLALNQREWSPTHNRQTFGRQEDSARIKDYQVSVSTDAVDWTLLKSGTLESARGVRFIDLSTRGSWRYIRLEVDSTWAAPTVTSFYKKLRIDELYAGYRYASPAAPTPLRTFEAESGAPRGTAAASFCLACSGGADVTGIGGAPANDVTIQVSSATGRTARVVIYGVVAGTRSFFVSVNGHPGVRVPLAGTSFVAPAGTFIDVKLHAGDNTIRFYNDAAPAPDLDRIAVG